MPGRFLTTAFTIALLAVAWQEPVHARKIPVIDNIVLPGGSVIQFDSSNSEPILEYRVQVEMLADDQTHPQLQVFTDGRVIVYRPEYMKDAGEYETRLSRGQLRQLISGLGNRGLMQHDPESYKHSKSHSSHTHKGEIPDVVSDDVVTRVDIRLHSYRADTGSPEVQAFHKHIKLRNIHADKKHFPSITEVQNMSAAVDEIRSLMKQVISTGTRRDVR